MCRELRQTHRIPDKGVEARVQLRVVVVVVVIHVCEGRRGDKDKDRRLAAVSAAG
jgi:hypothetical protein